MNTVGGNEARFCIKWISGVPKHSWETCARKDKGAPYSLYNLFREDKQKSIMLKLL